MTAYYNEFDQKAAAWLRELIKRGLIAPQAFIEACITGQPSITVSKETEI
jgi:DNA (cytosine-5)-methyltransferase 1